jgi:hypothetical protein
MSPPNPGTDQQVRTTEVPRSAGTSLGTRCPFSAERCVLSRIMTSAASLHTGSTRKGAGHRAPPAIESQLPSSHSLARLLVALWCGRGYPRRKTGCPSCRPFPFRGAFSEPPPLCKWKAVCPAARSCFSRQPAPTPRNYLGSARRLPQAPRASASRRTQYRNQSGPKGT